MRTIILPVIILSFITNLSAQNIFISSAGTIEFTSDAPLELIEAKSDKLEGMISLSDRSFSFDISMASFEGFNSKLQQTHFNENYIETSKYPKATFEGKIIEEYDFSKPGTYDIRGKGFFSVHGIKENRIIRCKMVVTKTNIEISSNFTVFLEDHNISIPSIVNQKIAEEIKVKIKIVLKPEK
ncbi:MAG: YceI family protein [Tenuifilaceae bacterium]|nr:YceI family protein [Tenuifilaceae bacterium]